MRRARARVVAGAEGGSLGPTSFRARVRSPAKTYGLGKESHKDGRQDVRGSVKLAQSSTRSEAHASAFWTCGESRHEVEAGERRREAPHSPTAGAAPPGTAVEL